eukprot:6422-Heterococcus_DN1.PRE.1
MQVQYVYVYLVDVLLVHFISQQDQAVVVAELDKAAEVLLSQALPSRVARVNEHKASDAQPLGSPFAPAAALVQLVAYEGSVVQGDRGRVQRVLRHWHHHAVIWAPYEGAQYRAHSLAGAVGQEDAVRVSLVAVPRFNEACNLLPDIGVACAVAVGSYAALDVRQVVARTRYSVWWEHAVQPWVFQQEGGSYEGQHLAREGQWLLAKAMWVTYICEDDLLASFDAL